MIQTVNRIAHHTSQKPIVEQVRIAISKGNKIAMAMGFLLGAIVPIATFSIAHYEVNAALPLYLQMPSLLVLGGLCFSAKTVFDWAKTAFKHPVKALGFVLLIEGVMTFSTNYYLSIVALVYLIVVNGLATGCNLVLDYKAGRRKK